MYLKNSITIQSQLNFVEAKLKQNKASMKCNKSNVWKFMGQAKWKYIYFKIRNGIIPRN